MKDERLGWLTDIEQHVLERPTLVLGAETLHRLGQLSEILDENMSSNVAESVRAADEETVRAIRKAAGRLLDALRLLPDGTLNREEPVTQLEVVAQEEAGNSEGITDATDSELVTIVHDAVEIVDDTKDDENETSDVMDTTGQSEPEVDGDDDELSPNALKFLKRAFDFDDSLNLTKKDIAHLTHFLMHARGAMGSRTKLDYRQVVAGSLQGLPYSDIAKIVGSTPKSVTIAAMNFIKAVAQKQGGVRTLERRNGWGFTIAAPKDTQIVEKAPVPQPPKVVLTRVTVPVDQPKSPELDRPTLEENLQTVAKATEAPNLISEQEWFDAARSSIVTLAEQRGFTAEESLLLWERVHYDASDRYAQPADQPIQGVMGRLAKIFIERSKECIADKGLARENVGVRTLVMATGNGLGTLDTAREKMAKINNNKYTDDLTRTLTQRYVVNGIVALLK